MNRGLLADAVQRGSAGQSAVASPTSGPRWADPMWNSTVGNYAVSTSLLTATYQQPYANCTWWTPFWWPSDVVATAIGVRLNVVGTAGAGDTTCRLSIYGSDTSSPLRPRPGPLVSDAGTLDLTVTTGWREIAIREPLAGGAVWWASFCHGLAGTMPSLLCYSWSGFSQRHQFGWDSISYIAENSGRYTPNCWADFTRPYSVGAASWRPAAANFDNSAASNYGSPVIAIKTEAPS